MAAQPPPLPKRRMPALPRLRNYAGAQVDRLTEDWFSSAKSVYDLVSQNNTILRNRCRELERNNDFVSRFLQVMEQNVVGPRGLIRQSRVRYTAGKMAGKLDRDANRKIEAARREWGQPGNCTACGLLSERDFQAMALRRFLVDGEFIARKRPGFNNGFGFALEPIDADCLDWHKNQEPAGGRNRISCGVEVNADGRPVAYHLLSADASQYNRKTVRVPADQIVHLYIVERPRQPRGISWLAPTMVRTRMLDGFEQAAVVAARVAASKMGFFSGNENYNGDGVDPEGFTRMSAEPGEFEQIPNGLTFQPADFAWPNVDSGEFTKAIKKSLSAGVGISYHTNSGDLEGVNFTSSRTGELQDRQFYRCLQARLTDYLLEKTDRDWLSYAITAGAVNLPYSKLPQFLPHVYAPQGWDWVDPYKQAKADETNLQNKTTTLTRLLSERGLELDDHVEILKSEKEALEEIGAVHPAFADVPPEPEPDPKPEGDDD